MAIAAWLVWRRRTHPGARSALFLFGLQLALNLGWTGVFFAMRRLGAAFGEMLLLQAAILATLMAFGRISRRAVVLLAPYLAWVTFAAALNFAIWQPNR